jgi:hypothetical protein
LGMWAEDHKEFPDEASRYASTFVFNRIINTPSKLVLQVEVN